MTNQEVINQLKELRSHCQTFSEDYDGEEKNVWKDDVSALNVAITRLEEKGKNNEKFINLLKLILNTSDRAKEKVVGYDSETFEELRGKVVKLYLPIETLWEMEKDIQLMEVEDD